MNVRVAVGGQTKGPTRNSHQSEGVGQEERKGPRFIAEGTLSESDQYYFSTETEQWSSLVLILQKGSTFPTSSSNIPKCGKQRKRLLKTQRISLPGNLPRDDGG